MKAGISDERWRRIRLAVFDVDGVLTDGGLYIGPDGAEVKRFDIKDGAGLKALLAAQVTVAIISSRPAPAARVRAVEIGVKAVFDAVPEKARCVTELAADLGVEMDAVAYMGDDTTDAPVLGAVGIFAAPADAHPSIRSRADWVSAHPGGRGAVRELADIIVAALTF